MKHTLTLLATLLLAPLAWLIAAGGPISARAADQRPNVLFIAVDDWNDWVGAMGSDQVRTPNLDRLAKRGVTFTYAHCNAVYCAPSRTALMTGRHPTTTGFYHDEPHFANAPELIDLPGWFKKHGYKVHGGGKLYHHMPGFIDMRSWDSYYIWNDALKRKGWGLDSWGDGAPVPPNAPRSPVAKELHQPGKPVNWDYAAIPNDDEEKMADTRMANWAVGFLQQKHNKPFFLGAGLYAPHKPNYVPKKYFDMYPLEAVKPPVWKDGDADDLPPLLQKKVRQNSRQIHERVVRLNAVKQTIQAYLAALSYADAMVGRMLDALEAGPNNDNTVIVLWSDNGYHLGEKGWWAKHTLWERTSNVPFLWAGPGVARGQRIDTTVSLLDTYRTLTDLCGLPTNPQTEGVSLRSILADPASAKDRTIVQSLDQGSHSAINQQWRYTHYANGEEELYHIAEDSNEWTNLAESPEYSDRKGKLAEALPQHPCAPGKGPGRGLRLSCSDETFSWLPVGGGTDSERQRK